MKTEDDSQTIQQIRYTWNVEFKQQADRMKRTLNYSTISLMLHRTEIQPTLHIVDE